MTWSLVAAWLTGAGVTLALQLWILRLASARVGRRLAQEDAERQRAFEAFVEAQLAAALQAQRPRIVAALVDELAPRLLRDLERPVVLVSATRGAFDPRLRKN